MEQPGETNGPDDVMHGNVQPSAPPPPPPPPPFEMRQYEPDQRHRVPITIYGCMLNTDVSLSYLHLHRFLSSHASPWIVATYMSHIILCMMQEETSLQLNL